MLQHFLTWHKGKHQKHFQQAAIFRVFCLCRCRGGGNFQEDSPGSHYWSSWHKSKLHCFRRPWTLARVVSWYADGWGGLGETLGRHGHGHPLTLFFPVPYSIIYWVYCSDVILIFASVDSLCWFYAWNSRVEIHVNTRNKGKTTLCSTQSSPICFLHSYIWKFLNSLKSHPVLRVFFLVHTGSMVKGPGFGLYLICSSKQSKETHRTCRVRLLIDFLQIERKPS